MNYLCKLYLFVSLNFHLHVQPTVEPDLAGGEKVKAMHVQHEQ